MPTLDPWQDVMSEAAEEMAGWDAGQAEQRKLEAAQRAQEKLARLASPDAWHWLDQFPDPKVIHTLRSNDREQFSNFLAQYIAQMDQIAELGGTGYQLPDDHVAMSYGAELDRALRDGPPLNEFNQQQWAQRQVRPITPPLSPLKELMDRARDDDVMPLRPIGRPLWPDPTPWKGGRK